MALFWPKWRSAHNNRTLLRQRGLSARNAYPSRSYFNILCVGSHLLTLVAWQRSNVHDAMRWLGGEITLFRDTPCSRRFDR